MLVRMTAIATQGSAPVTAATRFALLTAIEAAIKAEKESLKPELIALSRATDATGFNSPFGKISITTPQASVVVTNETALIAYVKEVLPNAVSTIEVAEEWARASVLDRLEYVASGVLLDGKYIQDATIMQVPADDGDPDGAQETVALTADGEILDDAVVATFFFDPSTDRVVDFAAVKPAGEPYPAYPSSPAKKAAVQAAREFITAAAPQLVDSVKELTQ